MDTHYKFNNFIFKSDIGELLYKTNSIDITTRLQPQPNKLLKLLLDTYPDVVTHDQIKKSLWSDVQVDFDGSIHFCIRQIRAALNENSKNIQFIETIPKVGYRWKVELQKLNDTSKKLKTNRIRFSKNILIITVTLSIILSLFLINLKKSNDVTSHNEVRIAVMPFKPEVANGFKDNSIGLKLVERLTDNDYELKIIGPTTTSSFNQDKIWGFVDKHEIDIIINGKFSNTDEESELLAEVIRCDDGVHVWVKSFKESVKQDSIVKEIEKGCINYIINTTED